MPYPSDDTFPSEGLYLDENQPSVPGSGTEPYPSETLYPSPTLYPGDLGNRPGVRPSLAELEGIVRARTRKKSNGLKGKFADDTNPTLEQAEEALTQATNETAASWVDLPANLYPLARQVALYRAGVLVERSYFPELVASDDGTVHDDLYNDWIAYSARLDKAYSRATPNKTLGSITLASAYGGGIIGAGFDDEDWRI